MSGSRGACRALLLVALMACEKPGPPPEGALPAYREDASSAPPADAGVELSSSTPAPQRMHVRAVQGHAQANGELVLVGAELSADTQLELSAGASITLSLQDHVRLQISGPALVQLLPGGKPALLVRQGLLTLDLAPRGNRSTESAFWLATPALRLDVADSVRVALRAFAGGATELAVVSGYLTVSQAQKTLAVPAASSVCLTLDDTKIVPLHAATLELAQARLSLARNCAPRARVGALQLESAHREAARYVEMVSARELEELAAHARAVSEDPARAVELRDALAHLGAELVHLRERERALSAQRAASALRAPREAASATPGQTEAHAR